MIDAALEALVDRHHKAEIDALYEAYDGQLLDEPDGVSVRPHLRPPVELGMPDAVELVSQALIYRPSRETAFVSADGTPRRVLLVGSLPYADEASAMARAVELAGDRLMALPDGEIGERSERYPAGDRSQWVAGLAGRPAGEASLFDIVDEGTMDEQGFPVDFDSTVRLRPRVGPAELADRLRLGYDTFALRSWPHFERLQASVGRPDLRMQVGLPTGFGAAAGLLGPLRALRSAPAFAACAAREAEAMVQSIGAENLLFQIEAPAEVVAAHRPPRLAVGVPTGPVADLVRRLPAEVPVGLHLCFGDLNNITAVAPARFDHLTDVNPAPGSEVGNVRTATRLPLNDGSLAVGVCGEDAQRAAAERPHDAEVPFVQRRDGVGAVPVGQHDQRSVGQAQRKVPVALHDGTCPDQIVEAELRQLVRARGQFRQQSRFGVHTGEPGGEVVQFGQYQRRHDQWPCRRQDPGARCVHPLIGNERR